MAKRHYIEMLVLAVGAFLSFAPLWAKYVQTIAGHGLFVTSDSLVLLGITLFVSLLGSYLLPDSIPRFFSQRHLYNARISRPWAIVGGLLAIILLAIGLYAVNQKILHSFLSSADEHSCYFLAECLRKGKLYVDLPPLSDFFKVVHVGMCDGKWFSVYPLGWPLIWALGLQLNMVDWLNPLMSSLAVFFFYLSGSRLFGRLPTTLGLAVMCLNPFFLFTGASYFSHGTCLLCISIFLYAFLRWQKTHASESHSLFWASLCGFATGYGLITRPLTMFAIAAPFLTWHYFPKISKWKGWGQGTLKLPFVFTNPLFRKSDWIFASIVVFFLFIGIGQNLAVTGKPFKSPLKYYHSSEQLGFKQGIYTPIAGFFFIISRIFYLMDWFAPAFVVAYLVLLIHLQDFKNSSTSNAGPYNHTGQLKVSPIVSADVNIKNIFRLAPVFLAGGYFLYYSWGGNQWGPRYWWEGIPFLCIAVADWGVLGWQTATIKMRKFLIFLGIMICATSIATLVRQAEYVEESSRQRRALYDLAEQTIKEPAIVFIHGFLGDRLVLAEEDAVRNSPFLDKRILYVHDLGERNKKVMAAYRDRTFYRGTYDRERLKPQVETITEI